MEQTKKAKIKKALAKARAVIDLERMQAGLKPVSEETWQRIYSLLGTKNLLISIMLSEKTSYSIIKMK